MSQTSCLSSAVKSGEFTLSLLCRRRQHYRSVRQCCGSITCNRFDGLSGSVALQVVGGSLSNITDRRLHNVTPDAQASVCPCGHCCCASWLLLPLLSNGSCVSLNMAMWQATSCSTIKLAEIPSSQLVAQIEQAC